MKEKYSGRKRVNFLMPEKMFEFVAEESSSLGLSVTGYLNTLVNKAIKEKEQEVKKHV